MTKLFTVTLSTDDFLSDDDIVELFTSIFDSLLGLFGMRKDWIENYDVPNNLGATPSKKLREVLDTIFMGPSYLTRDAFLFLEGVRSGSKIPNHAPVEFINNNLDFQKLLHSTSYSVVQDAFLYFVSGNNKVRVPWFNFGMSMAEFGVSLDDDEVQKHFDDGVELLEVEDSHSAREASFLFGYFTYKLIEYSTHEEKAEISE